MRHMGRGSKPPVVADSELLDTWIRHEGGLPIDTDTLIAKSRKLRAEVQSKRQELHKNISSLHEGMSAIQDRQAKLEKARQRRKA